MAVNPSEQEYEVASAFDGEAFAGFAEAAAQFSGLVTVDGSLPTAALAAIADEQLIAQAWREASPLIDALLEAMGQPNLDPDTMAALGDQIRAIKAVVDAGRPDLISGLRGAAMAAIQQAAGTSTLVGDRTDDREERARQLWGRIGELNEQIANDIDYFHEQGFWGNPQDEQRRLALLEEMEEIRRRNPQGYMHDPRYQALQGELGQVEGRILDAMQPQVQDRGTPEQQDRLRGTQDTNAERDQATREAFAASDMDRQFRAVDSDRSSAPATTDAMQPTESAQDERARLRAERDRLRREGGGNQAPAVVADATPLDQNAIWEQGRVAEVQPQPQETPTVGRV